MPKKKKTESEPEGKILILSDSTGDTAENYVRAILAQFQIAHSPLKKVPNIVTDFQLKKALESATAPCLVVYTFALEKLRKLAWSIIRDKNLIGLDLFYPAVEIFSNFLHRNPNQTPGMLHSAKAHHYFDRVEAIEFTVKHDDGMKLEDLSEADIILIGVSRTSKTPTSIYLAHKGYRVANVPMVPGIEVPRELIAASKAGVPVICLTIREQDLERIRKSRLQNLVPQAQVPIRKSKSDTYVNPETIREELEATQKLSRKYGWPQIDVTDKAIEETASEILVMVSDRS